MKRINIIFKSKKRFFIGVAVFIFFFGSASLSKQDIQKIKSYKDSWLKKNKSLASDTEKKGSSGKTELPFHSAKNLSKEETDSILSYNIENNEDPIPFSGLITTTDSSEQIFPSSNKQGQIGVFSNKENDLPEDNFFNINLPNTIVNAKSAYLEYDLFGLASHISVSRSINRNVAIGGNHIVPNPKWSTQREEINISQLKSGLNTILFTAPANDVRYKVKNVKLILSQKEARDPLDVSYAVNGREMYLKGFVRDHSSASPIISGHNNAVALLNGEFETSITLNDKEIAENKITVISAGKTKTIRFSDTPKPYKTLQNELQPYSTVIIDHVKEEIVNFDDIKVEIDKETFEQSTLFKVYQLREKDLPALESNLKNTTLRTSGIRISSNELNYNKKIKITLHYDEKKLGASASAKEIRAFHFDYKSKKWNMISNSSVDESSQTISFEGDGDGDYINGIISVPESPQVEAFAPTTISGIQAADPTSKMQFISPPSTDQKGDANLSYPIIIPAGRKGMQPNLSLVYNSSSGNGWMGEGWNISGISSISIDTRWGAPVFNPANESELYSLDSEMLVYPNDYLPHRHNLTQSGEITTIPQNRNTTGVKTFYLRKNHDFTKIERYGNSPSNYRWIVTSATGIKSYYGGDENGVNTQSVLKTNEGNISQWGIYKIEDPHKNNIKFYYDNMAASGTGSMSGARIFNIKSITYTGFDNADGGYSITFKKENSVIRQDLTVNVRQGINVAEPYRLKEIIIENDDNNSPFRRIYRFEYSNGEFNKSLLTNFQIQEGDLNDTYNFDYYNDLKNGNTTLPIFGSDTYISTFSNTSYPSVLPSGISGPSKVDSNYTKEEGTTFRAGLLLMDFLTTGQDGYGHLNIVSYSKTSSTAVTKKAHSLIDFDGDGITDIIYKKNNGLFYRPGSLSPSGALSFSNEKQIQNFNSNFSLTTTKSKSSGLDSGGRINLLIWELSLDRANFTNTSKSITSTYLIDANNDGLMDVAHDGEIWFNKIENDVPSFTKYSSQTENMLIKNKALDNQVESLIPHSDVVKVWIAPKDGVIRFNDKISIENTPGANAIYSVEMANPVNIGYSDANIRIYLKKLQAGEAEENVNIYRYNDHFSQIQNMPPPNPNNHIGQNNPQRLTVKSGDKVYVRLHENDKNNFKVYSNPEIVYVDPVTGSDIPNSLIYEQDGFYLNNGKYSDNFFLNNQNKGITLSKNGSISIHIPTISFPRVNDKVTLKIILKELSSGNESLLYTHTYQQSLSSVTSSAVTLPAITIDESNPVAIFAFVESDSHTNFKNSNLNNITISYSVLGSASYIVNLIPFYNSWYISDFKPKTDLSGFSSIAPSSAQNYGIELNKNAPPAYTLALGQGPLEFKYIIKKGGLVLGKRKVKVETPTINTVIITETDLYTYQPVNGIEPISIFSGIIDSNMPSEQISIQVYCDNAYQVEKYKVYANYFQNGPFNIYYGSNQNILTSVQETSINSAGFNHVTRLYNNWGQFLYEEKYDVGDSVVVCVAHGFCDEYGITIEKIADLYLGISINPSNCSMYDPVTQYNQYMACIAQQAQYTTVNISDKVTPMTTFKTNTTEKWIGMGSEQYAMADSFKDDESTTGVFTMPNGTIDPPNTTVSPVDDNDIRTVMEASDKIYEASTKTETLSGTSSIFGVGANMASSEVSQILPPGSVTVKDFMDMNGDGYPDLITKSSMQMTNATGELRDVQSSFIDSYISDNRNHQNTGSVALSFDVKRFKDGISAIRSSESKSTAKVDDSRSWSAPIGVSGSTNYDSRDYGKSFWMDINGDGLTDYIDTNESDVMFYRLNTGKSLLPNNYPFPGLDTFSSRPLGGGGLSFGGSLSGLADLGSSFNLGFGLSLSVGQSFSSATSEKIFKDINGDGLVDILTITPNATYVNYNHGVYYGSPTELKRGNNQPVDYTAETRNNNGYVSLGGSLYVGIPLFTIPVIPPLTIYLKIGLDASANFGMSITDVDKTFMDLNGDGFPDLVRSAGNDLIVNYSKIGRTNKLKTVSNLYTKSTFILDYVRTTPRYSDPNARLVLDKVTFNNPDILSSDYTSSNPNKNVVLKFEYNSPKYNRRERKFLGFGNVTTSEYRGLNLYNKTINNYYNTGYHNEGILKSSMTYTGSGILVSEIQNSYQLYRFNSDDTGLVLLNSPVEAFDTGGREGRRKAVIKLSETNTTIYDNGSSVSTTKSFAYNPLGQISGFQYSSPTTSYNTAIEYHTGLPDNIISIPSSLSVYEGAGTNMLLRKRTTVADNTGNIIRFTLFSDSNITSSTDYTYDSFGNIIRVEYPPNANNERYSVDYKYDQQYNKYITEVSDLWGAVSLAEYESFHDEPLKITDPSGNYIEYEYDEKGRLLKILGPKERLLPPVNGGQYTINFVYDMVPWKPNSNIKVFRGSTIHYNPDDPNNPIETISFADYSRNIVQTKKDIAVDGAEKMSVSGLFEVDQFGRKIKEYHPGVENKNLQLNGQINFTPTTYFTEKEYDYKDRVKYFTDENGHTTEFDYEIISDLFVTTTSRQQNIAGNLMKNEVHQSIEGLTLLNIDYLGSQGSLETHFDYDAIGQLYSVSDPQGLVTHYEYDMAGRKTSQLHPDHGQSRYEYDSAGNLIKMTTENLENDPDVSVPYIEYIYSYNRLANIRLPDLPTGQNPANVGYEYDTIGRIAAKVFDSGVTFYEYGNLGEVVSEANLLFNPYYYTRTWFEYDSWNRIRTISFEDGEEVVYSYDQGGNLMSVVGEDTYIETIYYDHYGQRTKVFYGNGTISEFTYNPEDRLLNAHKLTSQASPMYLFDNRYNYDYAGNITGIHNYAQQTGNTMGGDYHFAYMYDQLNRLISAGGDFNITRKGDVPQTLWSPYATSNSSFELKMIYNEAGGIKSKLQTHEQDTVINPRNTYNNDYKYYPESHKVESITEQNMSLITDEFYYDYNGNLIHNDSNQKGPVDLYWDEFDRLKAHHMLEFGYYNYYTYNDVGERTQKFLMKELPQLFQNGVLIDSNVIMHSFKLYPNPYIVVSSDGTTSKHYYDGSRRIASRVEVGDPLLKQGSRNERKSENETKGSEKAEENFRFYLEKAGLGEAEIKEEFKKSPNSAAGLYYLHGDHLGTATFVTDIYGVTTQFFLNLPFGETMAEQNLPGAYNNPYKFNAKELDEETGLYYYGARYYDPRLSIWYGVDPLAVYNPVMETEFYGDGQHNGGVYFWGNLNPYIYTYQNPIRYIDPNGKQVNAIVGGLQKMWNAVNPWAATESTIDGLRVRSSEERYNEFQKGTIQAAKGTATAEVGHVALDAIGIIDPTPIADTANAIWYAAEGDWGNAAISGLAIAPYIGDTGKVGKYGGKLITQIQKHHIIPQQLFKEMPAIGDFILKNSGLNLKKLPNRFHGNHPAYTNWIRDRFSDLASEGKFNKAGIQGVIKKANSEINKAYKEFQKSGQSLNDYFKKK